jgi:hypothetical protein
MFVIVFTIQVMNNIKIIRSWTVLSKCYPGIFVHVYAVTAYRWSNVQLQLFLILASGGSEWTASCPGLFTPEERTPSIHNIMLQACSDLLEC